MYPSDEGRQYKKCFEGCGSFLLQATTSLWECWALILNDGETWHHRVKELRQSNSMWDITASLLRVDKGHVRVQACSAMTSCCLCNNRLSSGLKSSHDTTVWILMKMPLLGLSLRLSEQQPTGCSVFVSHTRTQFHPDAWWWWRENRADLHRTVWGIHWAFAWQSCWSTSSFRIGNNAYTKTMWPNHLNHVTSLLNANTHVEWQ